MIRSTVLMASVVLALAVAPAGGAWTQLAGGVQNTVVPALIVTQAGTMLAAFDAPGAGTISVARAGGVPKIVVANDPVANRSQLAQQPNGAIQLYFPNAQGVGRLTSTDDGVSWTGPIQTQSHTVGPVESVALLADGTPLFSQDGTGFVNVFRGLNGETVKNVYPRCCGSNESLAVDTAGLVQIALYSNADPDGATAYEPLGADLAPAATIPLKPVDRHEAPLVADRSGTTFLAWAPGYPTATGVSVVPFRNGSPAGDGVTFRGAFGGGDPHLALGVDPQDRLWAVWTAGGAVYAARSRSHGMHFGATVRVPVAGTIYQAVVLALAGTPGTAEVVVNTGSSLLQQAVQPGLSVRVFKRTTKHGARKLVSWWAQALDDSTGVAGALVSGLGCRATANAAGVAPLTGAHCRRGPARTSAPGYVGAAFRVP